MTHTANDYDPYSPDCMADPHPYYAALRAESPVHYLEKYDAWALARFEDVWAVSQDARHFSVSNGNTPSQVLTKTQPVTPMFALQDPPQQTKVRAAIRHAFGPASIAPLSGTIRECVERCFESNPDGFDVVQDLGLRISVRIALGLIGLPLEDGDAMVALTQRFFAREPGIQGTTADGLSAVEEMNAYFVDQIRARRGRPANDPSVLDLLLSLEVDGRALTEEELCANLQLLVHGGTETFPKVLSSTLVRLCQHPDQRARVVREPDLAQWAFREALRIDMPTQMLCRTAVADVDLGGQRVRAGQGVALLYASANRDEREFDAGDDFDIDRRPQRILSFGHGIHACLGRNVALLEGRVALDAVLERAPEYDLDLESASRLQTEFVQGFHRLRLVC